jgi:hypothetical protein
MTTTNDDRRAATEPDDQDPGPNSSAQIDCGESEEPHDARTHSAAAHAAREAAARAVMHPDWHDTDWRYYFGAWGG